MNCKFKYLLFTLFISFPFILKSQDTITVMQYNLLDYDNSASACIPIATKTAYIKTITKYVKPDILGVNEMYPSSSTMDYLLNNALNTDGVTSYKRASYTNLAGSNMVNTLYYNNTKLGIISNTPVQTIYRDINIFKLYFKAYNLAQTKDTAYLYVVIAHLKASQGYEADRDTMTSDLMNHLNAINIPNNYLFQGDLNLYTSTEQAYQNLISNANVNMKFYDPINKPGAWHNSSSFAGIHTQSTHNTGTCFATSGMDDRFDFILISNSVKLGTKKITYITNSYKTIGQDGLHYNNDINASPTNTSAPTAVISALYGNSDHLPVSLKLKVSQTILVNAFENNINNKINIVNPVSDNLQLSINIENTSKLKVQIISIIGKVVFETSLNSDMINNYFSIPLNISKGIYLLKISDINNHQYVKKIIKE